MTLTVELDLDAKSSTVICYNVNKLTYSLTYAQLSSEYRTNGSRAKWPHFGDGA